MKLKDKVFCMDVAKLAALRSHAIRLKVGAVACDSNGDIVAYAYNGTVHGMDNCCEDEICDKDGGSYLITKSDTIHAEPNLIAHCARRGISIKGGTVFLTHSPCMSCAALMLQSGIKEVYFLEEHRSYEETRAKYGNMFQVLEKFTG